MKTRIHVMIIFAALALLMAIPQSVEAKTGLDRRYLKLEVGNTYILKVKGTKKKVKWSSNRKKVVLVSQKGKVIARKAGKAIITAKVNRKKYRCNITVTKKSSKTETAEKKTSDQPDSKQPVSEQPDSKQPVSEQPGSKQPVSEQPGSKQPGVEQPSVEQPSVEQPSVEQPSVEQPGVEQPSVEQPSVEQPSVEQPGAEENAPGKDTIGYDAGEYSITNTHSGEATYYEPIAGGAANLDSFASGYYTAAMNNYDYMNGMAGAYIEITDKDGDKINVLITDRLPEGKKGDIDLKPDAFEKIEPKVTGRMAITWKIIPLPTKDPIQYVFKPESSQYWAEIQVRNHRYPVNKLEYLDAASGKYIELERQEYNYFKAKSGLGGAGPYTFRVTDIYGHQLTDTGIALNKTSTPVNGKENFPY